MIWLKLLFSGLWRGILAVVNVALKHPWQAACLIFAAVALWQTKVAHEWKSATEVAQATLKSQQAAIVAGQKQAEAMQAARNARIAKQQEGITDDVSQDYARRLADLRARYERLRGATQGSPSAAGGRAVSGVPGAPIGVDEAPGDQGFSFERRMTASEQAEQLDALITWLERQAAVDPNEGKQ